MLGICLVGNIAVFIFDILPFREISGALYYVTWFVAGIFAGMLSFAQAGAILLPTTLSDWSSEPAAGKLAYLILAIQTAILAGCFFFCYRTMWNASVEPSGFVPDSLSHSVTFLGATLVGGWVAKGSIARPKTQDVDGV